jgi:hypothetical protein
VPAPGLTFAVPSDRSRLLGTLAFAPRDPLWTTPAPAQATRGREAGRAAGEAQRAVVDIAADMARY